MIHNLVNEIKEKAKANPKRIVFPEGDEDRVLQAVKDRKSVV